MDIIEIRNNLVKLSYGENENPSLGDFIALTTNTKSYVAQFVNLKADSLNNFAVARLMFTFNTDGVVSEYDGSIPGTSCTLIDLAPNELLDLLPVETPIKIGNIAGHEAMLNVDISIFEHNFTIFSHYDNEKTTVISNFVRQLFRLKEKSVVIDTDGLLSDYSSFKLGKDFKLPLSPVMIDYIFEYDLKEVDNTTKAIIQDIFNAVSQYIKTLNPQFIPIDNFIEVVTNQYKETKMPELALLKNKLLKYQEAGIFANTAEDFSIIEKKLNTGNCIVFDLKDVNGELQKEIISYIHQKLENTDQYIYYFVPLYDDNSDKKLIKRLINNSHVFTTFIAQHNYKYAAELKNHAQDIMFFAPQDLQQDFGAYNTFLNKLNPQEAVVFGTLTQGVPLIVTIEDLDLDLTKDDVFGDRKIFYPKSNSQPANITVKQEKSVQIKPQSNKKAPETVEIPVEDEKEVNSVAPAISNVVEPVDNIMGDNYDESTDITTNEPDKEEDYQNDELTEEDLDFIENTQDEEQAPETDIDLSDLESGFDDETVPVVPVYTPDEDEGEEISGDEIGYNKGDAVTHPRYGQGIIEKIIKYGNKTLCSINFENVGRRLLDPSVTEFEKV